MKRFALATTVLLGCWLSVSLGQQIDRPEQELKRGDLIVDPANPPEEQPSIEKHDSGYDFFSLLKAGQFVTQSSGGFGQYHGYRLTVTNDGTMRVSRIGNDYVELLQTQTDRHDGRLPGPPVRRRIHKSMIVEIEIPEPSEPEKAT